MYMNIHTLLHSIHTYTYIYVHIYIYLYTYLYHLYIYIYTYIHTSTHIIYIYIYVHLNTNTCIYIYIHKEIDKYIDTLSIDPGRLNPTSTARWGDRHGDSDRLQGVSRLAVHAVGAHLEASSWGVLRVYVYIYIVYM